MSETTRVITQQRFYQGFTYEDFLKQPGIQLEQLAQHTAAFRLGPEDAQFFKDVVRSIPIKVIAIVGDNGGGIDVHRALPVMVAIARASGMELRVFPKSKNLDMIRLYLNHGKFESVPVFAFFDENLKPLCHWIEQPRVAADFKNKIRSEPNKENLPEAELTKQQNKLYVPLWPAWRLEQVRELRELLSGIPLASGTDKR